MKVVTVLRSGGEYRPEHVTRLRDQLLARHRGAQFVCLSDVPVEGVECIPLEHGWPGWWSKMEVFRPAITGSVLYMDLDSAIVGDLWEMAGIGRIAIMRDVYRPDGLQSSVMCLPQASREKVWRAFASDPEHWMRVHKAGGDQAFLERLWRGRDIAIWQDALPGQVVSWKVHVKDRGLPEGARFVAFHGKPRPWEVGW